MEDAREAVEQDREERRLALVPDLLDEDDGERADGPLDRVEVRRRGVLDALVEHGEERVLVDHLGVGLRRVEEPAERHGGEAVDDGGDQREQPRGVHARRDGVRDRHEEARGVRLGEGDHRRGGRALDEGGDAQAVEDGAEDAREELRHVRRRREEQHARRERERRGGDEGEVEVHEVVRDEVEVRREEVDRAAVVLVAVDVQRALEEAPRGGLVDLDVLRVEEVRHEAVAPREHVGDAGHDVQRDGAVERALVVEERREELHGGREERVDDALLARRREEGERRRREALEVPARREVVLRRRQAAVPAGLRVRVGVLQRQPREVREVRLAPVHRQERREELRLEERRVAPLRAHAVLDDLHQRDDDVLRDELDLLRRVRPVLGLGGLLDEGLLELPRLVEHLRVDREVLRVVELVEQEGGEELDALELLLLRRDVRQQRRDRAQEGHRAPALLADVDRRGDVRGEEGRAVRHREPREERQAGGEAAGYLRAAERAEDVREGGEGVRRGRRERVALELLRLVAVVDEVEERLEEPDEKGEVRQQHVRRDGLAEQPDHEEADLVQVEVAGHRAVAEAREARRLPDAEPRREGVHDGLLAVEDVVDRRPEVAELVLALVALEEDAEEDRDHFLGALVLFLDLEEEVALDESEEAAARDVLQEVLDEDLPLCLLEALADRRQQER